MLYVCGFYFRARGDYDVHISCAYLLRWSLFTENVFFSSSFLVVFLFTRFSVVCCFSFTFQSLKKLRNLWPGGCCCFFICWVYLFWCVCACDVSKIALVSLFCVFFFGQFQSLFECLSFEIIIDQQNWLIYTYIKLGLSSQTLHLFSGFFFNYAYKNNFKSPPKK